MVHVEIVEGEERADVDWSVEAQQPLPTIRSSVNEAETQHDVRDVIRLFNLRRKHRHTAKGATRLWRHAVVYMLPSALSVRLVCRYV